MAPLSCGTIPLSKFWENRKIIGDKNSWHFHQLFCCCCCFLFLNALGLTYQADTWSVTYQDGGEKKQPRCGSTQWRGWNYLMWAQQGWEFALWFFVWIACFFDKKGRITLFALLLFIKAKPKSHKVWYTFLNPVVSFPTLKKSKLLFPKKRIALEFEKNKRRSAYFALVAL